MLHSSSLSRLPRRWLGLALLLVAASCESPSDPDGEPDPGPGPHFSASPIELDKLARVTPIGTNGKILPIGHTYWYTCDTEWLLPVDRPCVREHVPIRAPGDAVVARMEPAPDGEVTLEGPPGLYAVLSHVDPVPGLEAGDRVEAGDTVAYMNTDFAFDFWLINYGIEPHRFLNEERYVGSPGYLHSQSPIAVFEEPLRSQLIERVSTRSDPLGKLVFDEAGTAAGNWFLEGTPVDETFTLQNAHTQMFLGRLQERDDIRIVSKEAGWFTALLDLAVVDPDDPYWEDITPATGRVWIRLWEVARDGGPNYDAPRGGLLVEVLEDERLRIEHFDTHEDPSEFTPQATVYER